MAARRAPTATGATGRARRRGSSPRAEPARNRSAAPRSGARRASPRRPSGRPRERRRWARPMPAPRAASRQQRAAWRGLPRARGNRSPVTRAMSANGPSGRGVNSASQSPHSTRANAPTSSQKRRRTSVFPTPASPETKTTPPRPSHASAKASRRPSSTGSRSSKSEPILAADYRHRQIVAGDEAPIKRDRQVQVAGAPNLSGSADAAPALRPYRRRP